LNRPPPKLIYNVPDFHNPTGVTMSLARRQALVRLAADRGCFVIEDSPYRKVRFEGESVATLRALDPADVVLYAGTFSKLMAPGLRVGWLSGAPELLARAVQLKSDGGSCPLTQRIIVEFLNAGRLAGHIDQVRNVYRANRDAMVSAVAADLPEVKLTVPEGGYYLWLTLPAEVDGDAVAREAAARGVVVLAGSRFFARADEEAPRHHLRAAYSHANAREIREGVRQLAHAYRAVAERAPATAAR
jgi:2-aminoadipate transaminase